MGMAFPFDFTHQHLLTGGKPRPLAFGLRKVGDPLLKFGLGHQAFGIQ